jgi:hypothetical protein
MLRNIDKNIWVAEQPLKYFGLSVGTRMTVIALANQELVVISPIKVNDTIVNQLNDIGNVRHIIAPNLYHYLFAANFKALYPQAIFWATPGLEIKKPELLIDKVINTNKQNLLNGIDCLLFDGFKTLSLAGFDSLNECVFLHTESKTLILTDTAFHFDDSFPLITQFAARLIGGYKTLSPSLLEKIATEDKEKVKQAVQKVLTWDFDRVIMAHGSIIENGGKEKFKQGYELFLA